MKSIFFSYDMNFDMTINLVNIIWIFHEILKLYEIVRHSVLNLPGSPIFSCYFDVVFLV